jgi:hypothetical protein
MGTIRSGPGCRHDATAALAACIGATYRERCALCDGVPATGAYSFFGLNDRDTFITRPADTTIQTFYNIPVNDPLTQTMSHFASMTEVVNDALGHANCLGSGYIMRRVALESIGGFPTESLSEDICCSATLLGEGWKTAFVPEVVQYGCVPESYLGHIKQRTRWVSVCFPGWHFIDNHGGPYVLTFSSSGSATSKRPYSSNSAWAHSQRKWTYDKGYAVLLLICARSCRSPLPSAISSSRSCSFRAARSSFGQREMNSGF